MRRWRSGQSQQAVNLSPHGFAGSNPARRTKILTQTEHVWVLDFVRRAGFEGRSATARGGVATFFTKKRVVTESCPAHNLDKITSFRAHGLCSMFLGPHAPDKAELGKK
jgi:hypothetical protein